MDARSGYRDEFWPRTAMAPVLKTIIAAYR